MFFEFSKRPAARPQRKRDPRVGARAASTSAAKKARKQAVCTISEYETRA